MMEVPGLLEGAHQGVGLGHQFLRHAERARLYVHLLDGLSEDPVADYEMINEELMLFNPGLARKPQVVVVNKVDVTEVREDRLTLEARLKEAVAATDDTVGTSEIAFISAATGEGVNELMARIAELLAGLPKEIPEDGVALEPVARPTGRQRRGREIVRVEPDAYVIESDYLERLSALADTRDQRVLLQLWREMRRSGVAQQLVNAGIEVGDTIRIGEVEVEWF